MTRFEQAVKEMIDPKTTSKVLDGATRLHFPAQFYFDEYGQHVIRVETKYDSVLKIVLTDSGEGNTVINGQRLFVKIYGNEPDIWGISMLGKILKHAGHGLSS